MMGKVFVNGVAEAAEMVAELVKQGLVIEMKSGTGSYEFIIEIKGY